MTKRYIAGLLGMCLLGGQDALANTVQVTVSATINSVPCSVPAQDSTVPVDLGASSLRNIRDNQPSVVTPFQLHLDCASPGTNKFVRVTFGGNEDTELTGYLAVNEASGVKGIAIGLVDSQGQPVSLNKPSSAYAIVKGSNVLDFGAFAHGEPSAIQANSISTGEFNAVATAIFAYE